jgi:hypothetical protein
MTSGGEALLRFDPKIGPRGEPGRARASASRATAFSACPAGIDASFYQLADMLALM